MSYEPLRDAATLNVGDSLRVGIVFSNPTWAATLAIRPELLIVGWTTIFDYSVAQGQSDVSQLLKPVGSTHIFVAEVSSGNLTGVLEPDWSAAPNVGDAVTDGDLTWHNAGNYVGFGASPSTWAALTAYPPGALVWPIVPNGHLYLNFGALTSGASEPAFPKTASTYVADGDGYWMDCGPVADNIVNTWLYHSTFFKMTTLSQGSKTFTVEDPGVQLDGVTGTISVAGAANVGTYTIDHVVSSGGLSVVAVEEAIGSATFTLCWITLP